VNEKRADAQKLGIHLLPPQLRFEQNLPSATRGQRECPGPVIPLKASSTRKTIAETAIRAVAIVPCYAGAMITLMKLLLSCRLRGLFCDEPRAHTQDSLILSGKQDGVVTYSHSTHTSIGLLRIHGNPATTSYSRPTLLEAVIAEARNILPRSSAGYPVLPTFCIILPSPCKYRRSAFSASRPARPQVGGTLSPAKRALQ
jgi:hypothetical protein